MIEDRSQSDRVLVAQLTGEARHRAQWRKLTGDEEAAAVAEFAALAGGRADLLADVAGIFEGVTEGEMVLGTTGKTIEERFRSWIDTVGTITLPLLAGFSITFVIVVSDDAANFLLPGAAILVLAFAAVVLIIAVQCAYHARVYLVEQDPDYKRGLRWARWTRRFYDAGLLALLAGLALVVAPHSAAGIQAGLRWSAFGLAWAAFLGEVIWAWRDPWLRSVLGAMRHADGARRLRRRRVRRRHRHGDGQPGRDGLTRPSSPGYIWPWRTGPAGS